MKKRNSILYESERLRKKRDLSKIDRIKQQKEKKKKKKNLKIDTQSEYSFIVIIKSIERREKDTHTYQLFPERETRESV